MDAVQTKIPVRDSGPIPYGHQPYEYEAPLRRFRVSMEGVQSRLIDENFEPYLANALIVTAADKRQAIEAFMRFNGLTKGIPQAQEV